MKKVIFTSAFVALVSFTTFAQSGGLFDTQSSTQTPTAHLERGLVLQIRMYASKTGTTVQMALMCNRT
jgi:hypothetical protein